MIIKEKDRFKLISLEIELLKTCSSDLGFFQRYVTKTIPLIRKVFFNQIQTWEIELLADDSVIKASKELTDAFISTWEVATSRQDIFLKKKLIALLRLIRGPRFEFGEPLIKKVYPILKELYVHSVCIPEKYPFAITTLKLIKFEKVWKNHYNHWDLFTPVISFQTNRNLFPKKVITRNTLNISYSKNIFKIVNKRSRKPRNNPRSIVHLPYLRILYEMESLFAPTAKAIYLQKQDQFIADQQCYSKFIWLNIQTLEKCWTLRNENIFNYRWHRLRGNVNDIGLLANSAYNSWLLIAAAEEFKFLDKPNRKQNIFKREDYMTLLSRLILELQILHIFPDKNPTKDSTTKDLKMPIEGSDEFFFCEWYAAWLEKKQKINPHNKTVKMAISEFKNGKVKLKKKYEDSTYKEWIRRFRKRKKASLSKPLSPQLLNMT